MASIEDLQALLQNTAVTISGETQELFTVQFLGIDFSITKSEIDDYLKIKNLITAEPVTSIFILVITNN